MHWQEIAKDDQQISKIQIKIVIPLCFSFQPPLLIWRLLALFVDTEFASHVTDVPTQVVSSLPLYQSGASTKMIICTLNH